VSHRVRKAMGRNRVLLTALISVAILVLLAFKAQIRLEKMWEQFRHVNWGILIGTLVFSVLWHVFVGADKWWRIMRALGAPVRYWEVFRVRLGSDPIRFATPMKAGEVVNAVYFARLESLGFSRAAGSVLFDKALNLFGAVFWLYVGFAALAQMPTSWELAVHTSVGAAVLVLIAVRPVRQAATALARTLHPKLGRLAAGVLSAFEEFSPARKIGFLLYGIIFQLRPLAVCALLLIAFQPDTARLPSLQQFLAYGSVVVLMSNVPSMGGIGPREYALAEMFKDCADYETLLTVGLSMSFAVQVLPAILGIPLMFPLLRAVTPEARKAAEAQKSAEPQKSTEPQESAEPGAVLPPEGGDSQLPITQVE
jgi:uncharacterized membrane protein YbhN (UPF0104 family)